MGIKKRLIVITVMAIVLSLVFAACADNKDDTNTTESTVTTTATATVAHPQNAVENTNEGTGYEEEEGLEEAVSSQGTTTSKVKSTTTTTKKHTTTKATSTSTTKKGTTTTKKTQTTTKKTQTTTKKSTTTTLPKAPVQDGEWGVAIEN